jgi:hypothetical protein
VDNNVNVLESSVQSVPVADVSGEKTESFVVVLLLERREIRLVVVEDTNYCWIQRHEMRDK